MNSRKERTTEYEFRSTVLIVQFRLFVLALDKLIEKTTIAAPEARTETRAEASVSADFSGLVAATIVEIRRVGQWVVTRHPELSNETVHDFQFLMSAWADEAMIKIGQDRLPVEQRGHVEKGLFGTVFAGEEFFLRVEKSVDRRSSDDICLGGAYLLALIMGFEGRYIGGAGAKELRRYADKLQSIAVRKTTLNHHGKDDPGNALDQENSTHRSASQRVTRPWMLAALFAALLGVAVLTLEVHWIGSTGGLVRVMQGMSDMQKPLTEYKTELK